MNSSQLKEDIEKSCRFCSRPDIDRIIYETSNFYVMLSLGPIVEGYLLICTKDHIECCGKIDESIGQEFDLLIENVRDILISAYGHCLFYEHGRAGTCMNFSEGSKHCHHAHMHCIPVDTKLNDLMDKNFCRIRHDDWKSFRTKSQRYNEPYLFVDDGRKVSHLVIKEDIRRQYLRHLTATSIGKQELWNWVDNPRYEIIQSAKTKLIPYFSNLKL